MKVFLRSQKPRRAHGSQTRFLSRQPANKQSVTHSALEEVKRRNESKCCIQNWTVESLDAPHVVLGDVPLSGVGGVRMHQSLRVSGVPQAESVTDLMSRHLDQVVEPHACRVT